MQHGLTPDKLREIVKVLWPERGLPKAAMTDAEILALPPGRHRVAPNLYIEIDAGGRRRWFYRYMLDGKQRSYGLGSGLSTQQAIAVVAILREKFKDPVAVRAHARELLRENRLPDEIDDKLCASGVRI